MAVPRGKSDWAERVEVAVETSVGSATFAVDDRLRADTVEVLSDADVGAAHVSVHTDGEFTSAEAVGRYYADRRIIVRTPEAVLFDGYPVVGMLEWPRGRRPRKSRISRPQRHGGLGLELEHVVGRLDRDVRSQIIGRQVRDGIITDGLAFDPNAWVGSSVLLRGLPCVFNMDGTGNCDPVPIKASDGAGSSREVYIFADDARADAVMWTFAKVLRYLLHFYTWGDCPVGTRSVFEQTEDVLHLSGEGRAAFLESDPLAHGLLGQPDTLVLEATSLLEAVVLLSAASGLHLTAESAAAGRGVQTMWRVWSDLSGPRRELHLATDARDETGQPVYDPATVAVVDLFEDNNISSSSMQWDGRSIGETALVVGDVKQYEVQVELLPGWLPEADLDNVPAGQRASAKAKARTEEQIQALDDEVGEDAWYRAYHRRGEDFASYWKVDRLWVLNEAGTYEPGQYARNTPFDSYAPYDFAAVYPGRWMRRFRRLLPIAATPGGPGRVRLEVSFDGGSSWRQIDSGYQVLAGQCGVWFDLANPLAVAPSGGGGETNLWYALIDQTCRVRVTALVESDERLVAESAGRSAPTMFRNATVLYAPERFRFLQRLDISGGGPGGMIAGETASRDDSESMNKTAALMAAARQGRAVTARPVIPWLDTSYAVGDRIVGVRGRGLCFSAERTPSRRWACVIGKRYRFGAGRFETELLLASANGVGADQR
jgi:hypothetical protein